MKNRKCIALLLALFIVFALVSCTRVFEEPKPKETNTEGSTVLASEDELTLVIGSHPSWPYDENMAIWRYIREAVGGKLTVNAIPNSEILTKVSLMMASPNSLPDLIHFDYKQNADNYAGQGALIALDDYIDLMPNYTQFWNSIPEDEREELLMVRKFSDGKTYYPQIYGMERQKNVRAWLYRKDIFEKHDLSTPETLTELYELAVKLKELYPESYPICMRTGLRNFGVMGPQWKPYFTYGVYYDFVNGEWKYGAAEDTMLEMVEFFIKLYNEGLVPPDYLTINTKTWEELISTGRGFIMPEYQTRISFFHNAARSANNDFTLDAMMPPRSDAPAGQNMVGKYNVDPTGFVICNTQDENRIKNSVRLIDWFYSDEATELVSWGKEGETYHIVNGEKKFITESEDDNPIAMYGFQTLGTYLRIDPPAADAVSPEEQTRTTDFILQHTEERQNPVVWLALNDEESKIRNDLGVEINTYVEEMLSKFLLAKEPLSNWGAFQKELKEMGVDELTRVYESAYSRVTK